MESRDTSALRSWLSNGVFLALMLVAYVTLLIIPYSYDQYNREQYRNAIVNDQLVIQEFISAFEKSTYDQCIKNNQSSCETKRLFEILSSKKIISLDYVLQMKKQLQIEFIDFLLSSIPYGAVLILSTIVIFLVPMRNGAKLAAMFVVFIFTIAAFHLLSDLPHKNTKYHYIFGTIYGLSLSLAEFFRRIDVFENIRGAELVNFRAALSEKHSKWTSVLNFSLASIAALVGTTSFTTLGYLRIVFGESFIFAPLIGIMISTVFASGIIYFGIIRKVLNIIREIETQLATAK